MRLALLRVLVTLFGQSPEGKRHQHREVPQGVMLTLCICHLPTFLSIPSRITGGILGLGEDFGSSCLYYICTTLRKMTTGTSEGNVCTFGVWVCDQLLRKCEQGKFISELFLCPCQILISLSREVFKADSQVSVRSGKW